MKKNTHLNRSTTSILACAALSCALYVGAASAQTLLIGPSTNNGGFESVTAKTNFTPTASPTTGVPYWGTTGAVVDSGAEPGAIAQAGTVGSFYRFTDSPAFNLASTYRIQAGDQFTLTWFARSSGATLSSQTVTLFSQSAANSGATYTYQPVLTLATTTAALPAIYTQYTLTYTALPTDAGNSIGLTFANSGAGTADTANTFVTADSFTLSVTPVPEPSTYAVVGAGLVGLALLRRRLLAA